MSTPEHGDLEPLEPQPFYDLYFRLGSGGEILDYSASAPDLYAPAEQFLGRRMQDVLPSAVGQQFEAAIARAQASLKTVALSYVLPIQGAERHYEARLLPLPESQVLVIARDVSRYARVSASRDQLAAILEATPDYVGLSDAEGRPLYINRAGRSMVGLSPDEALPSSVDELHPGWANALHQSEAAAALERDGVWRGESALRHRDGREIPTSQVILAHRTHDGALDYFSTTARDISGHRAVEAALRESERRLATLIDSLPGIAFACHKASPWSMSYFSEGCLALTGYRPDELVNNAGLRYSDITRPDDLPQVLEAIDQALSQRAPYVCEYRIRTKGGAEKWVWEKGQGVYDEAGQVVGLEGFITDISDRKQAESKYRSIFDNALEGIFQTTADGKYLAANPALARIYGYSSPAEMMEGITNIAGQLYVEPGQRAEFVRQMGERDQVERFESAIRRKDGSVIWISENSRAVRDLGGLLVGYDGTVMDITARKEAESRRGVAEAALRESEARLRDIVEHSSNLFFTRTPDGQLTYLSPQVSRFFDYEPHECPRRWDALTTSNPINATGFEIAAHAIETGEAQPSYNLEMAGRLGRRVFVEVNEAPVVREGQAVAMVGALVDVTQRHAVEQQLKHQAFHDSLTGLPNRLLFMDRLQHALSRLRRHPGSIAVLFLDLDRFKVINDSMGHEVGDQLLQAVTGRLIDCLRPDDTVARLGGDEFTVLMEDVLEVDAAAVVAERVADALQKPFVLRDQEVFVTTSVGIAISHDPDASPDDLLRDADVAMYRAKVKGRAQYEVFDPRMNARALERLTLETDLWQAVGRNELRVHYQPKVDLRTGRISGLEALVRWQHPRHGLVPPGEFIPLAEETGIILSIGRWVLHQACAQARRWMDEGVLPDPLQISVNLSARQIQQPTLAQEVAQVLVQTGLPAHLLKLEITESVVMGDAEHSIALLRELKALGVQLAVDDFGTGYSSLSYLRRFPVSTLKIDRSFISNLGTDREDTEIVRAIINLAQTLGLDVTAEGIENASQMQKLQSLGCDWGQGYLFSTPLPADAISALLLSRALLPGTPQ